MTDQPIIKQQLQTALTAAMKARDEVALSALRQALSAIAVAETAGDEVVVLSDAQVVAVLAVEVRMHHETADAFVTAGRPERVDRSRAEAAVLEAYLPAALGDDELQRLIGEEIGKAAVDGATGMKAMGRVVSAVRAAAGPSADGAKIAAMVKTALAG
ncbi:MAG: GatB/YqeY domain-containing protein [Actinomycetota bacterium]|nr:GatB/YqeY domain-containing protein [Actinomycetota bacterium]